MSVAILVNRLDEVTADQTTWSVAQTMAAVAPVVFGEIDGLSVGGNSDVRLSCHPLGATPLATRNAPATVLPLAALAHIIVRFNPGREPRAWAIPTALTMLHQASCVTRITNDPGGLIAAQSKLYSARMPDWTVPQTLVTRDAADIRHFLDSEPNGIVVKPVNGTRGRGVFHLTRDNQRNVNQLLELSLEMGFVVAQRFLPAASEGDTRIILIDGELLAIDGKFSAVRRVPRGRDFRSNVHVGAVPAAPALRQHDHDLVDAVGPILRADGLRWVGLDVVGDHIIEVNTFSPGGLADAGQLQGVDFHPLLVERLLDAPGQ